MTQEQQDEQMHYELIMLEQLWTDQKQQELCMERAECQN